MEIVHYFKRHFEVYIITHVLFVLESDPPRRHIHPRRPTTRRPRPRRPICPSNCCECENYNYKLTVGRVLRDIFD